MPLFPYVVGALVVSGAAFTASLATSHANRPTEALTCELRLTETQRQVTVAAHVEAASATSGTYQLDVQQRGTAGRSTIRQGGEFALKAGEAAMLGEARLSGRAHEVQAELSVTADGKTTACRSAAL